LVLLVKVKTIANMVTILGR